MFSWIKDFLRGRKRTKGTKNSRGRVYQPRTGWLARFFRRPNSGPGVAGKAEPIGTISARVYRAATGEWEDHGVISTGRVVDGKIQEES